MRDGERLRDGRGDRKKNRKRPRGEEWRESERQNNERGDAEEMERERDSGSETY